MTRFDATRADVLCDTRWDGPHGIARFGREIIRRLTDAVSLPAGLRLFHPLDPLWLSLVIARRKPRVYFSPGFNPPLYSSAPFVFVVHDLNYLHCRENSDAARRLYFNVIVRPACKNAARVLTVSEFSRSQIIEWARVPASQVVNVSNGVDPQFSPHGARHSPGYPYLLYVGNRLAHKNLARLFAAFAAARVDCKLLLTGPADAVTVSLARSHAVEASLEFAGVIEDRDLPTYYRGARALVLPSLFEGFGLPVIEAMACGIPVAAAGVTALPEIAGDAALYFDPRSTPDMTQALQRILTDESLRDLLVKRGLHRASAYSWDVTALRVQQSLQSV